MQALGSADSGVGWAVDDHSLVMPKMETAIEKARKGIIAGKIKITDYLAK